MLGMLRETTPFRAFYGCESLSIRDIGYPLRNKRRGHPSRNTEHGRKL